MKCLLCGKNIISGNRIEFGGEDHLLHDTCYKIFNKIRNLNLKKINVKNNNLVPHTDITFITEDGIEINGVLTIYNNRSFFIIKSSRFIYGTFSNQCPISMETIKEISTSFDDLIIENLFSVHFNVWENLYPIITCLDCQENILFQIDQYTYVYNKDVVKILGNIIDENEHSIVDIDNLLRKYFMDKYYAILNAFLFRKGE